MDISQVFKSLISVLLVITFIMLVVNSFNQYQVASQAASLADAASSLASHLALEELAYGDGPAKRGYVVDPAKLATLENFRRDVGGASHEFYVSLSFKDGRVFGPYGGARPRGRANATLSLPVAVWENNRLDAAKLEVVVWRA